MALTTEPHKIFLIPEILKMILVQTDMQTLLTSAQRVCHQWHTLIQDSADLQAALFFKPVRYTLPHGTPGIRNPLLAKYIWPWFCSTRAQRYGAPPVEGGAKLPLIDHRNDKRFRRKEASWVRMLFQQPPRSCIGLVEKDGGVVNGPAYTEVRLNIHGDDLRIGDIVYPAPLSRAYIHPLPEEGLIWWGDVHTDEDLKEYPGLNAYRDGVEIHGEIHRSQVTYATSIYLRDCDIVLFTLHCAPARGRHRYMADGEDAFHINLLYCCLFKLGMSLVPGQTSIPMPSN